MKQLICLALVAWPLLAAASPSASSNTPQPQDGQASVPATKFRSAVDGYLAFDESDKTPDAVWVAANKTVGDAGGHMGHMAGMGKMDHMKMDHMKMDKMAPMKMDGMAPAKPAEHQHEGH
ncbi:MULTISPECIES: hypothetical protein [unclassified Janthinobacterium]|uniref:hypothetical protein n=1 Tax=unclassified Janthinobacterium TaxID=2610881 RepID=UPI0016073C76|nr:MULTISPECIES: hypothetical protein [unclassified Janthinobacterium]MBB5368851.1 hypothetical protein [Janthinobacterium sp. K2C7]MBB5381613.1 hypothetical protein [Janthinobacterium sp. K2Li3]MBB5387233.1 hypothetical protein [Janthinobacterium sp. K2E3]